MTPVVDSLAFVGPDMFGHDQEPREIYDRMARLGVDVTVIAPGRPRGYHLAPANQLVSEAQATSGGRLFGLARIDPHQVGAGTQAQACVRELHLRGLFLQPQQEVFRVNEAFVARLVEAFFSAGGRVVVVATGVPWVSEAAQVADLARRFPEHPFVMTNGGQFNISGLGQLDAHLALEQNPNLYVQTTGVYRQDFIEGVIAKFGAERLLYAGGSPRFDPGLEVLRVRRAKVSDADRELICGGSAVRLFGL